MSQPRDLALFHRELAGLVKAGLPLPRALRTVGKELGRGPMADVARKLADGVEEGRPLGELLAERPVILN